MPVPSLRRVVPLLSLLCLLAAPALAAAAPGDLDPGFGTGGRYVATEVDQGFLPGGVGLARDDQGRLLLGFREPGANRFTVRRLSATGGADPAFGDPATPGEARTSGLSAPDVGGVAVAPMTGRVIIAGNGTDGSFAKQAFVQDVGPTGKQDGGWAGGWKPVTVNGFVPTINDVAVQADGKIVVVGDVYDGSRTLLAVARLTATGDLDPTFGDGGDGGIAFALGGADSGAIANAVTVAADGTIVLAGQLYGPGSYTFLAGRLTPAGQPDTSFSDDGFAAFAVGDGGGYPAATGVALTPAGIVLGGGLGVGGHNGIGAIRVKDDGTLDTSFGTGGVAGLAAAGGASLDPAGMAVDADGRVLLGAKVNSSTRWALGRLTADGRPDAAFGSGGLATHDMGDGEFAGVADVIAAGGKAYVSGHTTVGGRTSPAVIRVDDSAGQAPAGGGDQGGGGTGTPQEQPAQPEAQQPAPAAPALTVRGLTFTTVVSTVRQVEVKDLSHGFHFTSAYEIQTALIPYLDLDWEFDDEGCKRSQANEVSKQTPAGGRFTISADKPLKMHWKICLETDDLAKFCSASQVKKTLTRKGADRLAVFDSVLEDIKRCKIDYDVKFTKKVDAPDLTRLVNTKAPVKKGQDPPKRKPIEAAIECSTNKAAQSMNLVWSEGASSGASYSFHASDPKLGWTIPAGVRSLFKLQVTDRATPVNLLQAKVFFDTDEVGAARIAPRTIDKRGETFFNVTPARTGLIRVCAVFEGAGGEAVATGAIRVVAEPEVGDVWETTGGRKLEMTRSGPRQTAGFGGQSASAAWNLGDAWNALVWLFSGKSAEVNQAAASSQPAAKKAAAVGRSGLGLAQIGGGGTLGALPGLPTLGTGPLLTVSGGQAGTATGKVLFANPNGTLAGSGGRVVAAGGGNVVSAGGANVVSAGGLNLLSDNGLGVVAPGGANVVSAGGLNLISDNGLGVVAPGGANVVAAGGLN